MISTDVKMLEEDSAVRTRMIEYGALFDELYVVVFTLGKNPDIKISKNVFIYPTNSISKLFFVHDAIRVGSDIGADVVTTQDPFETGLAGLKLSEKLNIPLHIQIHTDFHSRYFKHSLLNRARIAVSNRTLPQAAAIRAVSERIKDSLSPDLQAKTSVLPIFADLEAIERTSIVSDLRKKYPRFKKIVLMASRLTKEKDIDTALEAFEEILPDHPDTGLVIVGRGPLEEKIKKSGTFVRNPKSIVLLSWADHDTLVSYMKTCDAFLSASLYEGYGLSMLEACAARATLVATDTGIAPLLTERTAKPGDTENLSLLLREALSGRLSNKKYQYPYSSKLVYLEAYKRDIERSLGKN